MLRPILFLSASLFFLASCKSKLQVDLIVHHGKVYTVDSAFSIAQSFAVKDGRIIAVGSNEEVLRDYRSDSSIDAGGRVVYPGFIDAHAHFIAYGQTLFEVDLHGAKSWQEAVQRVQEFAKAHPAGGWIKGRGWDQNGWPGQAFPDNQLLNQLFPSTPVLLNRVDGHAAIANAAALDAAGIAPGQHIEGGSIEARNGKLTGLLIDNAVDLVAKKIPLPSPEVYERTTKLAQANCFAQGLTTVTDCGLSYRDVQAIETLQADGRLKMRLYVMLSDDTANYRHYLDRGPIKTDRLFVKGVKVYADGALGSRGACLLHPYADKPGWNGFLLRPSSHYDSVARMLLATDFQMCTHAIGDSGNRIVLQIYNHYLGGKNDRRWRIEHAQVVNPADFDMFGRASVVPSVQPTHATSDMYWAGARLGPQRLAGAYAYRQLLRQNGWIPLGTDFPVEDISPFKTFFAAVMRKDPKGFPKDGFQMEGALTREEALRGMSIWAAKAGFLEKEVGSLERGKKADFIILTKDLMKVPEAELLQTKVVATYIGGEKVFGD